MSTKVTKLEKTGRTWNGQNGTMHVFYVALEDGTEGEVNSAREDGPPYKAGDEVEYEVRKDHPKYGKTLSIRKADGGGSGHSGGSSGNGDQHEHIVNGMCFNKAVDALCATEWRENMDPDKVTEQVTDMAKRLRAAYDQAFNQ